MSKHKSRSSRTNYRTEEFVMYILHAEIGIHEAATLLPSITDGDVLTALNRLIQRLQTRSELPQISIGEVNETGVLVTDAHRVKPGDLIAARIVHNWHQAIEQYGERKPADLAGVLRTVLDSLQTWTRGPKSRGYLAYLSDFLKQAGVKVQLAPSDEQGKPLPPSEAIRLPEPPPDLDHLSLDELGRRLIEKPFDAEIFDAYLHRAIYYLSSGRGEELIERLAPLIDQARDERPRAELLWILGRAHLRLNHAQQAVNTLRRAVNTLPKFFEAWVALAEAHRAAGSRRAAAHAYEQARTLDLKRVEIYPPLAMVYRELGDPQSEIATWERYVAVRGHSPYARYELARAYRRAGRDPEAEREMARVRKLEPAARALPADWAVWLGVQIESKRFAQATSTLERALRREPQTNWFVPMLLLAAAEARGETDAAQVAWLDIQSRNQPWESIRAEIAPILREVLPATSHLLQPLRLEPGSESVPGMELSPVERRLKPLDEHTLDRMEELSRAGFSAVERGDYKGAERDFRRALAIAEGDATLFGLGVVCAMTNRPEEAFHLFERAVNLNGEDPDYWYNLGNASTYTMRPGRALRAFERCLELGLEEKDLRRDVEARVRLLRKSIDEMQRDWGSHLTVEQLIQHEDVFARAAEAMEREEYIVAVERFRESIALNERHYQSWGNLGSCLLGLGDLDEAEQALRRALELKPTYEPARLNLEALARVRAGGTLPPMVVINNDLRQAPAHLRVRDAKTK